MSDALHEPYRCRGVVKVYESTYAVRLLKTLVYRERGVCTKCGAELVGFASWVRATGVRVGVAAWFEPGEASQRAPVQIEEPRGEFDPPP